MIVLPRQESGWEDIISGFNTGVGHLAEGLTKAAERKTADYNKQQTIKGLQQFKFTPEEAHAISGLDPAVQKEFIKEKLAMPHRQAYGSAISQLLGGGQQQQGSPGMQQGPQLPNQQEGPTSAMQMLANGGLSQQEAYQIAKLHNQQQSLQEQKKENAFKATDKYTSMILDQAADAQNAINDLDTMQVLNKQGKVIDPLLNDLMEKWGVNFESLKSADTQLLGKMSNNFLRYAKPIFGSRLTNYDVQTFLKMVPNLSQTPEGRDLINQSLRNIYDSSLLRAKAYDTIIETNNGVPPRDIHRQIEQSVRPQIDANAKKFRDMITQRTRQVGNTLDALPPAKEYKRGDELEDENFIYVNTGSSWAKKKKGS